MGGVLRRDTSPLRTSSPTYKGHFQLTNFTQYLLSVLL